MINNYYFQFYTEKKINSYLDMLFINDCMWKNRTEILFVHSTSSLLTLTRYINIENISRDNDTSINYIN